ncbi:MAG TPA: HAD family hydrolase [Candidatus Aenigmarchaeota archaeon]|nr:MAG: hypothetical protein DRP03_00300 [Candidatus Aenigmarchaeota archaeon]HDD45953.1 HAD family hydrolase [Candidatus Aenigmarchaeota archaeon]
MKLKAIIFDMDGVLVDPRETAYHLFLHIAKRFGYKEPGKEEVIRLIGIKIEKIIERLFGVDKQEALRIKQLVISMFDEYNDRYGKVIDSVERVLSTLKYKKAIVSNSTKPIVLKTLERFNLEKFFDVIITSDDVRKEKPDPEALLLAIKKMGVSKDECVFVGDTKIDMLAANNAGIKFIGVLSGIGKKDEFGNEVVIPSIKYLQAVVS